MLRITPCSCGEQYLVRLNRSTWMRFVPGRRHYFCAKCKQRQWLPRRAFASWWLPAAPEASSSMGPLEAEPRGLKAQAQR